MLSSALGRISKARLALRIIDWLFLVAALALAVYGQRQFGRGDWTNGVLAFAGAMVFFAWAVRRVRTPEPATLRRPITAVPRARRLAGLYVLVISLLCLVGSLYVFRIDPPTQRGWTFYLASMGLFVLGFLLMEWHPNRAWWGRLAAWLRDNRWELFLLFVIVAVGATVRLVGLEINPLGIWFDESDNAVVAREILLQPSFRPLYATTLPSHYLYLMALAFKLFGVTAAAMRLPSALFGIGLIVAMWLLGRELGGRWVGLLAAGLMAASHWAINFSRIAMHGISTPFFGALSAYLLLRGLRTGSRTTLALGGLSLGLGLSFYAPFRLFPLAIVVFLLGKLIFERGFLKNGWLHVVVFVVASVIAFAPTAQWAARHPTEFFGRTAQTSVFAGKAPDQRWPALQSNIRLHLLMFNFQGDRNGRHNLPGAPEIDPFAGVLLPLGAALALARLHRPRQLFVLVWTATMLSGGIFSLDFEAPQALRTIGAVAPILLLIAQVVPTIARGLLVGPAAALVGGEAIHESETNKRMTAGEGAHSFIRGHIRGWQAHASRIASRWPLWLAVALAAAGVLAGFALSTAWNYDLYFVRSLHSAEVFHAFNAREAVVARRFVTDADKYRFYTIYEGHPTVRFLASDVGERHTFQPTDDLPVRGLVDRDVLYMLEPEFVPSPDLFTAWYPGGKLEWYRDVAGAPMLFTYEVSKDEVNESQGATFRLFLAEDREGTNPLEQRRTDGLGGSWDELGAGSGQRGEWTGQVFAPATGNYLFTVRSSGTAALTVDDRTITLPAGGSKEEARALPKGWHTVRLVADAVAGGEVAVEWVRPDGQRGPIEREGLSTKPPLPYGLYGSYYQNMNWEGMPAFGRIDWQVNFRWHVQPLSTPFSVEWQGGLKVDEPGTYVLAIYANAGASLDLNGQKLIDSLSPPYAGREIAITLEKGIYPIRVRYHEAGGYSEMRLQWRPVGGTLTAIPAQNLVPQPPAGVVVPNFSVAPAPAQTPEPASQPADQPFEEGTRVEATLALTLGADAKLERPRAVAAGADGRIYVADAGKDAVLVFDAQGKLVATWGKGKLREPADLVVDADGSLLVLDAEASEIMRFGADGKLLAEFGRDSGFYSPRGLALLPDGNLVVADTGSNRLVILSPAGPVVNLIGSQGSGPGQFQQPVDVAVAPDGAIYVADTMLNKRVQVLGPDATFRSQWLTPWVNEFHPPATAVGADGRIYMVDGLRGRVWEYAAPAAQPVWWTGGDMKNPVGVAVDAAGAIYVVDEETKAVYKFKRE